MLEFVYAVNQAWLPQRRYSRYKDIFANNNARSTEESMMYMVAVGVRLYSIYPLA